MRAKSLRIVVRRRSSHLPAEHEPVVAGRAESQAERRPAAAERAALGRHGDLVHIYTVSYRCGSGANSSQQMDRGRAARARRGRSGRGADRGARAGARRHQGRLLRQFDDRGALLDELLDAWERDRRGRGDQPDRERGRGPQDEAAPAVRGSPLRPRAAWDRRDAGSSSPSATGLAATETVARRLKRRSTTAAWTTCAGCSSSSSPMRTRSRPESMLAFTVWIGSHFIAADHGGRSRADTIKLALARLET